MTQEPNKANNKTSIGKTGSKFASLLILAIAGYATYVFLFTEKQPDIFELFEQQGYRANVGFSGLFAPGHTLQITRKGDDDKEYTLATPIVFLWAEDCFPGKTPRRSSYVLPEIRKTTTSALTIDANEIARYLPSLHIDNKTINKYHMAFDEPYVLTYSKATLNQHFSPACIAEFEKIADAGEKLQWYVTIVESVMANAMRFEISWTSGTSLEAREAVKNQYTKTLSAMVAREKKDASQIPSVDISFETDTEEKTVFRTNKPVILAYRYLTNYGVTD